MPTGPVSLLTGLLFDTRTMKSERRARSRQVSVTWRFFTRLAPSPAPFNGIPWPCGGHARASGPAVGDVGLVRKSGGAHLLMFRLGELADAPPSFSEASLRCARVPCTNTSWRAVKTRERPDTRLGCRQVNATLNKHATVDASNEARHQTSTSTRGCMWQKAVDSLAQRVQEALVDAFRSLAQHLTWADQNDPQLFDLFVELRVRGVRQHSWSQSRADAGSHRLSQQMVAHFSRVLAQCALPGGSGTAHSAVAVQLLQTLSILVLNTSRETSMYYLCSNNYLEDVLTCADKQLHETGGGEAGGSELLAWYVSFLKALSLRLDAQTIQFFVTDAQPPACRLYAHVLRYITHGDALVRAAARAAVLNVLKVNDPRVLQAALGDDSLRAALCTTLASDVATCTARIGAALVARPAPGGDVPLAALPPPWSDVAHACEELGASRVSPDVCVACVLTAATSCADDGLCYLNDLLHIGVPPVATAVTDALCHVALPPLLAPLLPGAQSGGSNLTAESKLGIGAALFGLSRLVRVVTHSGVTAHILASMGIVQHGGGDGGSTEEQSGEAQRRRALLVDTLASPGGGDFGASSAAVFLLASACDVEAGPPPPGDGAAATTTALLRLAADGHACADLVAGLLSFLDFACQLTSRGDTPPADVAAVLPVAACAGWTLRQLLLVSAPSPTPGPPVATHVASWRSAADGLLTRLLHGPWADAVMPLTLDTWRALSPRLLAPPPLSDVAVAGALVRCARIRGASSTDSSHAAADMPPASPSAEHSPSSGDADACLHAVRAWVVWHALGLVLTQHRPPEELLATALPVSPPSSPRHGAMVAPDALPSEFCDGFTLPQAEPGATPGGVFTCRVSFERGREKRLQLWCAPCAVHAVAGQSGPAAAAAKGEGNSTRTGMLLLTETVPIGMGHARIVRSVAPVLGSNAYIDTAHAKWLHVRVRPCVGALRMCLPGNGGGGQGGRLSSAGPFAGGGTQLPGQWHEPHPAVREQKRMQDGHWTLAFDTKEQCADALAMIQREAGALRAECGDALELLVQHMAALGAVSGADDAEASIDLGRAAEDASDGDGTVE